MGRGARGAQRGLGLSRRITSDSEQACALSKLHALRGRGREDVQKNSRQIRLKPVRAAGEDENQEWEHQEMSRSLMVTQRLRGNLKHERSMNKENGGHVTIKTDLTRTTQLLLNLPSRFNSLRHNHKLANRNDPQPLLDFRTSSHFLLYVDHLSSIASLNAASILGSPQRSP